MKILNSISSERKKYLNNIKREKFLVLFTQVFVLIAFLWIWQWLADNNFIDSFITSKPSQILDTLSNLGSNDLLKHIGVTVYETVIGFLLGTFLGIIIAIILWWSKFLSKVADPYLVVLNSLPKVALRSCYYYLGWCWYSCYYCYGCCNFFNCYYFREFKWFFKN